MLHHVLLRDIMSKFNAHRQESLRNDLYDEIESIFDKHDSTNEINEDTNNQDDQDTNNQDDQDTIKEDTINTLITNLQDLLVKERLTDNEIKCINAIHTIFNKTRSQEHFIESEAWVHRQSVHVSIFEHKYWEKAKKLRHVIENLVERFDTKK